MNTLTKLTAVALGALCIAGGTALAQSSTTAADQTVDGRADTANYGTPPGAPLKRDGSLGADQKSAPAATTTDNSMSSSTAAPAPAPATTDNSMSSTTDNSAATTDNSMQPRADRN